MNINSAFPSTYIKASDLEGRSVNVTIREVKSEQIGRDRDTKPVLYFDGKTKGMVLNKTNARKIASLVGSADTEDWTGAQIAIFPTETEFAGETVDCIRIKAAHAARRAAPPPPPPPPEPDSNDGGDDITDDDIPFAWLLPLALPLLSASVLLT